MPCLPEESHTRKNVIDNFLHKITVKSGFCMRKELILRNDPSVIRVRGVENELTYMGVFLVGLHNVIELLNYFSQNFIISIGCCSSLCV